jgi:SPP1 gp7 family putative phage head morphogenesis protein
MLRDSAIRHAIWLTRLREEERKRVMAVLSRSLVDVNQAIRDRTLAIERIGHDQGPAHTGRLHQLQSDIQAILETPMSDALEKMNGDLARVATSEAKWQQSVVQGAVPFRIDFSLPAPETLRAIGNNAVVRGHPLEDWWTEIPKRMARDTQRTIEVGIVAGKTNEKIVREMLDAGGGPVAAFRANASTIVRTSVMEVSDESRKQTYEENDDIVKGWQFVATLDARTSLQCIALDGKTFDLSDEEAEKKWRPPLHPNCRSTTVPVLKSYEEIGLKGVRQYKASAGTRASMDGQVPATTTYPEWLKGQPEWVQDEVLGVERADRFRDGEPVESFVDESGKTITLDELETLDRADEDGFDPASAPIDSFAPDVAAKYKEWQREQTNEVSLMAKLRKRGEETWTVEQKRRYDELDASTKARAERMTHTRKTGTLPPDVIPPKPVPPPPPPPPKPEPDKPIIKKPDNVKPVPPPPPIDFDAALKEVQRLQVNDKSLMSKLKAKGEATWTAAQRARYAELEARVNTRATTIELMKKTRTVPPDVLPLLPDLNVAKPTPITGTKPTGSVTSKGPPIETDEAKAEREAKEKAEHEAYIKTLPGAEGVKARIAAIESNPENEAAISKLLAERAPFNAEYDALWKQYQGLDPDNDATSELRNDLNTRMNAVHAKIRRINNDLWPLERKRTVATKEQIHEMVRVDPKHAATMKFDTTKVSTQPGTMRAVEAAKKFYETHAVKELSQNVRLHKDTSGDPIGRSWADRDWWQHPEEASPDPRYPTDHNYHGVVSFRPSAEHRVMVHEVGHTIEFANRGVRRAVIDFLEARGLDENGKPYDIKWLGADDMMADPGYDKREVAYANPVWGKTKAYAGKVYEGQVGHVNATYRNRGATETLSMGMELFYDDPRALMKADPEFFDLIVDILHGRYPPPTTFPPLRPGVKYDPTEWLRTPGFGVLS